MGYTLMVKLAAILLTTTLLGSCSQLNPLSLLTGGGTNVAANTQVGKENNQTIGMVSNTRPQLRVEAPVDTVIQDTSSTKNTEVDPLMLLLLILGWLAPSPGEISRSFMSLFKRK